MKTRYIVLLSTILVLCAAIGFSFGAYPHFWEKITGRTGSKTVLLLTSDQQSFPPNLAEAFFSDTGYDLQIQEIKTPNLFMVEAKKANLLYSPWEWLEASKDHLQVWPETIWSQLYSDFQSSEFFAQKFFPLFWNLQTDDSDKKKQFHFEGFATLDDDTDGAQVFLHFLLERKDLLKTWTQQRKLASTLQKASAWTDLATELKPQSVRENPLSGIATKVAPVPAAPSEDVKKSKK